MPPDESLHVDSPAPTHRFEMGDGLPPSDDGEVLTTMLDGIKEVREVPGSVRGGHIRHRIRLSDLSVAGSAVLTC